MPFKLSRVRPLVFCFTVAGMALVLFFAVNTAGKCLILFAYILSSLYITSQPSVIRALKQTCVGWICAFVAIAFTIPLISVEDESHRYEHCANNLKTIAVGLQRYHERFGCFPPVCLADSAAIPKHSWRVLLLPFIGENTLFSAYSFDEPWNGLNNSLLAKHRPACFACPSQPAMPETHTSYLALGASETSQSANRLLHIVEVDGEGIGWLQPRDTAHLKALMQGTAESIDSNVHRRSHGPFCYSTGTFLLREGKEIEFIQDPMLFRSLLNGHERAPLRSGQQGRRFDILNIILFVALNLSVVYLAVRSVRSNEYSAFQ